MNQGSIKISEHQKAAYKSSLKIDESKDFSEEFVRTTNLESKIIDEHGFDGIIMIFEDQNSRNYFELGKFPDDCSWKELNDLSIPKFISENFKPIADKIPNLMESMKSRCQFVYTEKTDNGWKLHFLLNAKLYDGRAYYRIYSGGLPNHNSQPNQNLTTYGWSIPNDLAEFYSIHDGFGEMDGNLYVQNSMEIVVMAEMLNPICKENNFEYPEDYKFEDLLEFFPDGAGNVQCFYRGKSTNQNPPTVDWDHEVWEISSEVGFYAFIDERMSEIDEE